MQNTDLLHNLIEIDRTTDKALYLQIANSLVRNIRKGRLRTGLKLPGSRKLADMLHINRMTVVAAYDELEAQGWIKSIPRKGTFVSSDLPEINPQSFHEKTGEGYLPKQAAFPIDNQHVVTFPTIDEANADKLIIDSGFPDTRLAPVEALMRIMRSISGKPVFKKYLRYGGALGTSHLRETLASHLNETRGLPISSKHLMITRGAQMGIKLTVSLLVKPGDQVIIGEPSYFGADLTFQQHGAIINRVPVDSKGIDVGAVEEVCKQRDIKLLYVIPHHHFPTTVTLAPKRRMKLLELAREHRFAILEDDYDYDFHYSSSPMLPMASLDPSGSVVYLGTLTKTLAPAIRIGFLTGPGNFISAVSNLRRMLDWQGDSLMEVAIAELYRDGTIARHIKKSVKLYRERRDYFCQLLDDRLSKHIYFDVPDGGMAIWASFIDSNLRQVARQAARRGLILSDGTEYSLPDDKPNSARLGFASLTHSEQERAIDILSEILL